MAVARRRPIVTALAIGVLAPLAACADRSPDAGRAGGASTTWTLGPRPLVEIGVLEGEEPYQLHDVRAAALLPDGRVAVANQGSRQIRVFDAAGRFRVASGGEGEGPGEWRFFMDVDHLGGDTLAVTDFWLRRIGFVDADDGRYLGTAEAERVASLQHPLAFHAGLLIEGLGREQLAALGPVLRTVDVFEAGTPFRMRVEADGAVLVFPTPSAAGGPVRVFDLEGRHRANLTLPTRFTPLQITEDRLVGVQRDSMDVERVQVWELEGRDAFDGPTLAAAVESTPGSAVPADPRVPLSEIGWAMQVARGVAGAQEVHYSRNYTYTDDLARLDTPERPLELPDGLEVQILSADASGWMGRFLHAETRRGCFLAYGAFRLPEGVRPGEFVCWET